MRMFTILALLMFSGFASGQLTVLAPDNWDDLVPDGKEVDAIYGDYAIGNDRARGVIAAPKFERNANMTVRGVAGCLIDFVTRDYESDQLSAYFPGRRENRLVEVQAGPDGSIEMIASARNNRPEFVVRYEMVPDQPVINITSTWTNENNSDITLKLEDGLRIDRNNEDMESTPAGTESLFWTHDLHWNQAYGIRAPGFQVSINDNDRETLLKWLPEAGDPVILKPGESWSLARQFIVARDLPEVRAIIGELDADETAHPVTFRATDSSGEPIANARLKLSSNNQSRGTCVTNADGIITARLPAGDWTIGGSWAGYSLPDSTTVKVTSGQNTVDYKTGLDVGTVSATVTDTDGNAIPAKVEFIGSDEARTPNWGPESSEYFVRNLAYTEDGAFDVPLAAGQYDVIISRGPEYDAVFTTLNVKKGRSAKLAAQLKQSVETPGWVSADFHSHSSPSGDNTGSQLGRVLNLAAEHIEFAPCTEHNRVSTYVPLIETLGLQSRMATVSGIELTGQPLPLNHQNAFPMIHRPRTQDGGGPTADFDPEKQMERLALWDDRSDKLIQQNHPDIGWLFFDRDGDAKPDDGFVRSVANIDVMEIHPIDHVLDLQRFAMNDGVAYGNQRMFNWLQLLNQGYRIYGIVNTDAHYNFHGSGGLRNWIQSSTDDPAELDSDEMMRASEQGRLVMSSGPYLQASFQAKDSEDRVVSGQDLSAPGGDIVIDVRVQCADWLDVDTVFLLINGKRSDDFTFTRRTHPRLFGKGIVKFEQSLNVTLDEDAHVIVVTGHSSERLGAVAGPRWGMQKPAALTNPVFVDIDADGFVPIGSTLDAPLPVKFQE